MAANQSCYNVLLEVADLEGESIIIGMDLIEAMGIRILGVPAHWPRDQAKKEKKVEPQKPESYPPGVSEKGIDERWREVLEYQANMPKTSVCALPNTTVYLDMDGETLIYVNQYNTPLAMKPVVLEQFNDWLTADIIEEQPNYDCPWNFPLTPGFKPKCKGMEPSIKTVRVAFDWREGNPRLKPLPGKSLPLIRTVLEKMKDFEYLSTLDCTGMYTQFMIAPEHRDRTTFTVGSKRYRFKRGI